MKLILKKFTNNEIKAYPGNYYLLNRTEEMGKKNKKRVNIENSQSEDSGRTHKIKKGLGSFSSV